MQMFKRVFAGSALALIVTAVVATGALITVMFTQAKEVGHYTGLFGSVFFDAHDTGTGSILLRVGIENPWPLVAIFAVAFVVSWVVLALVARRR